MNERQQQLYNSFAELCFVYGLYGLKNSKITPQKNYWVEDRGYKNEEIIFTHKLGMVPYDVDLIVDVLNATPTNLDFSDKDILKSYRSYCWRATQAYFANNGTLKKNNLFEQVKNHYYKDSSDTFTFDDMKECDLIRGNRSHHEKWYCPYQGRALAPIFDVQGNAVGFTARNTNASNTKTAKWVNTGAYIDIFEHNRRVELFNKTANLFGLTPDCIKAIQDAESAIIVEGACDAITMQHCGFPNTVSAMGYNLGFQNKPGEESTVKRFDLLKELGAKKLYICLDNDDAGRNAVRNTNNKQAAYWAMKNDLEVYVVQLKGGKDTDEILLNQRKAGIALIHQCITEAKEYNMYQVYDIIQQYQPEKSLHNRIDCYTEIDKLCQEIGSLNLPERSGQAAGIAAIAAKECKFPAHVAMKTMNNPFDGGR